MTTAGGRNITGVMLLNLGGPDSLGAVRPFLYNLFSDRDIIRLGPSFLQKPLAWLISTLRSGKTKHMYSRIGGKSPILDITRAQAEKLENALNGDNSRKAAGGDRFRVYIGMRYWHPFIKDTVNAVRNDGVKRLIVLTLYPHYSKATSGSSIDEFKRCIKNTDIDVRCIDQWFDFPAYINSLAESVAAGLRGFSEDNVVLLYSAHSLPQSFIDEGDPYLNHIRETVRKVNERLSSAPYNVTAIHSHLSFQSKTGPVKWLEPSTEETIPALAKNGCRNLLVVPVSFVSDHIETLYEIDILYRELAGQHGINLKRCASLNVSPSFIHAMKELVLSHASF